MTTVHPLIRAGLCLAFAASAAPAIAAETNEPGVCAPHAYSAMQARILDRAAQGPDALRRYVGIVQPLQQSGFTEAVAWIDGERERLAACRTASLPNMTAGR
ncbi:MAG: hypothetical protein ABIQ06_14495 [Caldimonas sp.]